jgi:diguanylate cyclase (GGDEF)-like protein
MERRSHIRLVLIAVWALSATATLVAGGVLAQRLRVGAGLLEGQGATVRTALLLLIVCGMTAAAFGLAATAVLTLRGQRRASASEQLGILRKRNLLLESRGAEMRVRMDELVTLREMATVVNYQNDFDVIVQQALELISGLLEPENIVLFLKPAKKTGIVPYAQFDSGKLLRERQVTLREIRGFDPGTFERRALVCRADGGHVQAIVPLRVEEETLGVLLLEFAVQSGDADARARQFGDEHRHLLMEIAHHLSLAVKARHLHTKAVVDALTQLYSRRHFDTQIVSAIEQAERTGKPFALVLLDIDHFKRVNDTHGHTAGDVILEGVAKRIKSVLRKYDTGYRYGGEELVLLLPDTRQDAAAKIAERLRDRIQSRKFRSGGGLIPITISLGVSEYEANDTAQSLFERADRRLYRAKEGGRNQVVS